MSSLLLGIDFGGTKNAVALAKHGVAEWLDYRRQISSPTADAQSDINTVLELSHDLLSSHSGALLAIGVSFGGPVDFENGTVRCSYHRPGWSDFPLQEHLQNEFDVPVSIDNDANAGAIGEWYFGAGSNCNSLLYITVSTGIGGGWILNGNPYRGANSMAGEIGHIIVKPNGPKCACGKTGCLEALACGPAISRQAVARIEAESGSGEILRHLCRGNPGRLTAEMVSQAANNGDELAQNVLLEAASYLGLGIGQALTLMNPERVVLGGGVIKAGKTYWAEVRRAASEHSPPGIYVDIVPAHYTDEAPLWGAIALANHLLSSQE
jgi:glucokinase